MNISIVSPVFPPEPVVSSTMNFDIARELTARGHAVTVITAFPSRPGGKLFPGFKMRLFACERHPAGFKLVRCGSPISSTSSFASRGAQNISFGILSMLAQLCCGRADVIYANTWPIFAAGCTALVSWLHRSRLILSVQDVYPESIEARARLRKDSLAWKLMAGIDSRIARSAQHVLVLCDSVAREYRRTRGLSDGRVISLPNWVQVPEEPSPIDGKQFRDHHGISSMAFVIAFAGTFAESAGVEQIIEASEIDVDGREVVVLLAGDGATFERCKAKAAEKTGARFIFVRPYGPENARGVLGASDILVVPTRGEISLTAVPSKLMQYMFAARPVVATAIENSELSRILSRAECGWVVPPDDPEALRRTYQTAMQLPHATLESMGRSAREFALDNFSPKFNLPRLISLMEAQRRVCRAEA